LEKFQNAQPRFITKKIDRLESQKRTNKIFVIKSMFGIAFEGSKSVFNTQKVYLKKKNKIKYSFGKKIKNDFKGRKSLKIVKTHFWQNLKNEAFVKSRFLT
jgi:hypothetical protein